MKKFKNIVAWLLIGVLCLQFGFGEVVGVTAYAQESATTTDIGTDTVKEVKEVTLEDGHSTWFYIINEDGTLTIGSFAYRGDDQETEEEAEKNLIIPDTLTVPVTVDGVDTTEPREVTAVGFKEGEVDVTATWTRNLESVTIPATVTKLNDCAFISCWNLKEVIFEEAENEEEQKALTIGEQAFWDCQELPEMELPKRTTSLGERAFSGCGKLARVVIPEGISVIKDNTFSWCNSLTDVTLPANGLQAIQDGAFCQCDNLEEIVIPEGVLSIGTQAFFECVSLKNLSLPDSLTSIGDSVFKGCTKLESIKLSNSLKRLAGWVFEDCTSLTSVALPSALETIDGGAFEGCSSLTGITLPDSLIYINAEAFMNCTKLETVRIPAGVKEIGFSVFSGCSELKEVILPEGILNIELKTFSGCSKLTGVNIPESVEEIRSEAFANCTALTALHIPSGVSDIGNDAFSGCSESFTIYTARGSYAHQYAVSNEIPVVFDGCLHPNRGVRNATTATCITPGYTGDDYCVDCDAELKKGTVEPATGHQWDNGVVTEKATAVEDGEKTYTCKSCGETKTEVIKATGVKVGVQVTDAETSAVYKVTSVKKKTVEYVKPSKTSVTKAVIPATITLAGKTYKVTGVDAKAFKSCKKLKTVTIGKNVTEIGKQAFNKCSKLSSITIKTTKLTDKNVGSKAFNGIAEKAVIKVPGSKLAAYKKLLKSKGAGNKVTIKK